MFRLLVAVVAAVALVDARRMIASNGDSVKQSRTGALVCAPSPDDSALQRFGNVWATDTELRANEYTSTVEYKYGRNMILTGRCDANATLTVWQSVDNTNWVPWRATRKIVAGEAFTPDIDMPLSYIKFQTSATITCDLGITLSAVP